jgi:flagellar biosynthesis GTPase FlhF
MPNIMISYRRDDSEVITGRIFDRLVTHYGKEAVFHDIDSVPLGVDFREHINTVLNTSDIVLAVVGPKWVGQRAGVSRLANAADPVRVKIEGDLGRNVPLIPILVLRGKMPRPDQLPPSLQDFAYRNALPISSGRNFDVHMTRLFRSMDEILEQKTAQAVAQRKVEEERKAAEARREAEEERQAAEAERKAEEERRAAEAQRKAEKARQAAETRRKAEEERQAAETRRKAEEQHRAAAAQRKAEEEAQAAADEHVRRSEERAALRRQILRTPNRTGNGGMKGLFWPAWPSPSYLTNCGC